MQAEVDDCERLLPSCRSQVDTVMLLETIPACRDVLGSGPATPIKLPEVADIRY